ncbi:MULTISPECIES: hypothetical protein [unclassified Streptomyces]|uniref:hypothetical protein n=1 Tax=unclassified Streptomyces TaxID=2593676 RepID=UPI001644A2F3|nr:MULTISPECIES: hypothetical protein [unclassified Streptomyces]
MSRYAKTGCRSASRPYSGGKVHEVQSVGVPVGAVMNCVGQVGDDGAEFAELAGDGDGVGPAQGISGDRHGLAYRVDP